MAAIELTLAAAVQGARNSVQTITWTGQNLTNATLTGTKTNTQTNVTSALDGTLALVTAASGIFSWTYGEGDVGEGGAFLVQFKATYPANSNKFDAVIESLWQVHPLQEATAVAAPALLGVTAAQKAFLDDVNITNPTDGQVLTWDDTAGEWVNDDAAGGGASTFLDLTDTPAAYTGQAGELVRVNKAEDELEFFPPDYALDTDFDTHAALPADSLTLGHVSIGNGLATDGFGLLSTFPVQQPFSDELTAIDNLTPTDSNIIVGNGTTWVAESGATARTSLGAAAAADLTSHTGNTSNPHSVTAAQVAAVPTAGGTMSGTLAMADNLITRPLLQDYAVKINAIGSVGGGSQDIDLTLGNVVTATVDTSETTFTFSNPPPAGSEGSFKLYLTNGGSQTVNWPVAVNWPGGAAPTLTAAGVDILVFTTPDSGVTWYGFAAGIGMA